MSSGEQPRGARPGARAGAETGSLSHSVEGSQRSRPPLTFATLRSVLGQVGDVRGVAPSRTSQHLAGRREVC